MATKPTSEPNKFIKLRKLIASLSKDIAFLSKCKASNVTPKSHRINIKTSLNFKRTRSLEKEVITQSIRTIRAKLDQKTLEAYHLHLKLAQQYLWGFPLFLTKVKVAEQCESERKRKLHEKKFRRLQEEMKPKKAATIPVRMIDNCVVNQSSQTFTEQQMKLLNKGLNHAIHNEPNIEKLVTELEAGICSYSNTTPMSTEQKEEARATASRIIEEMGSSRTRNGNTRERKIIKELKEKPVYYVKADKGNTLVILDQEDYDQRMSNKINEGPYKELRNDPLPDLVKRVDKTLKECKQVIGNNKLKATNPILPRIKGLPKIHKPGNEMREIVSAEGSPTHRLAKWLLQQFQGLGQQSGTTAVKNTKNFTQHLQSMEQLDADEIMVSFDVKALFPSIPVKEAISILEDWLKQQLPGPLGGVRTKQYIKLTKLCMEENFFTFRGKYFKQLKGAPMGNPLSPFISEVFMTKLESDLASQSLMPRFWKRYVDDIFAVIKKENLQTTVDNLNGLHGNIKFTVETEKEGRLPFLDILLIRRQGNLELEIYRKPTDTYRVIPNTSNHAYQHKMASFNHMIHRMLTLPISQEGLQKETSLILEIANLNGYPRKMIIDLINKRRRDLQRETLTSLTTEQQTQKRIAMGFNHISQVLRPKLRHLGIEVVYSSRNNKLGTLLGSTKDPVDKMSKSGVYRIVCPHCSKIYIGQTRRNLETRLKEHVREAERARKKPSTDFRSKVAEHIIAENHTISRDDIQMANHITDSRKLDAAESIEIYKTPDNMLLNRDQGNGFSSLFKFIRKYEQRTADVNTIASSHQNTGRASVGYSRNATNDIRTVPSHQDTGNSSNGDSRNAINDTRTAPSHSSNNHRCTGKQQVIKRTIRDFFLNRVQNTEEVGN